MIALLGCIYGLFTAVVFKMLTNVDGLRQASNRMLAHILEFGLFLDEPRTIFKAQRDLLKENLRGLRILATPLLAATAAFAVLYCAVDGYLARTALPAGTQFLITRPAAAVPALPSGAALDAPPVRVGATQTLRLRVTSPDNNLGHKPWLMTFLCCSTLSGSIYAILLIARETPNRVKP